ncbi:hypothetical protein CMI37_20115 [Candidatus Pacearchaeota archaeon]|nr:hypothetical protein [Candidatus Pacearchaeota archaeon]
MTQGIVSLGNPKIISVTKALAAAGNYDANDVLSESASAGTAWTFSGAALRKGGFGVITKVVALLETTALTHGITLYLFKATPTSALNDNVANTAVLHADAANYLGHIEIPDLTNTGAGDSEATVPSPTSGGFHFEYECAADDTAIYGIAVTRDAITGETATDDLIIKLFVRQG